MVIRKMQQTEYPLLENFLYEAIYIPNGFDPPPKSIIYRPKLQVYISGFGTSEHDISLVADINSKIVGAVWVRIMNDYGHIDNNTPSFAISVYKEYRRKGIGTALMKEMLAILKERGYKQASLSVQKTNFALKMYQKLGFQIIEENDEEFLMLKKFYD